MELSSFSEIVKHKLSPISRLIDHSADYWAHIDGVVKPETLERHTSLVLSYAVSIVEKQCLDEIIDSLCNSLASNNKRLAEAIKLLFVASTAYHDLGKINPNFQVDKMHNSKFKKENLPITDNKHSVLSAYLFLHYFADKTNKSDLEGEKKELLFGITMLLCLPILKHHIPELTNKTPFTVEVFKELHPFLEKCHVDLHIEASYRLLKGKDICIKHFDKEKLFPLFALLKLSYSLLTACDYYATNEYMAGIKINDFGIIDDNLRNKIAENFKTLKSYNSQLFSHFNDFLHKPFAELQNPSPINLNFLREKLTAEVISTIRDNPNDFWYYIEAPTGAGKTNLSLACISELLQSNKELNKVFYVFPFTTLITQTYSSIRETIGLNNAEMIQLHSKAGFHTNEEVIDGEYGKEKKLYMDNLFVNYPFCVTSHIHFFDILKGNGKDSNYLLHRLCHSIVVIDELQTYNPSQWDKILFFIEHYAPLFDIRFILMSATLPKIDTLSDSIKGQFVYLTPNREQYFTNENFAGRVKFDFNLLKQKKPIGKESKDLYLKKLSEFVKAEGEKYFNKNGQSRILIEFITKNTASRFFRIINESDDFSGYKLYLLSGDILEPRRRVVIDEIKHEKYRKIVLVSTQVIEAGVDIDMDLGFKDRSLLDSDEQLAGRVNRNAIKKDCKVFLFDCDNKGTIYGNDRRYKHQQKDEEIYYGFEEILENKKFDILYKKVFEDAKKDDWTEKGALNSYLENFKLFDFQSINSEFQLIEKNNIQSVYIPININIQDYYSTEELNKVGVLTEKKDEISGEKLFDKYISIISNRETDFLRKQIDLKKIAGLMSQFTISVYPNIINEISDEFDAERSKFGYLYLSHWSKCYDIEKGFDFEKVAHDIYL